MDIEMIQSIIRFFVIVGLVYFWTDRLYGRFCEMRVRHIKQWLAKQSAWRHAAVCLVTAAATYELAPRLADPGLTTAAFVTLLFAVCTLAYVTLVEGCYFEMRLLAHLFGDDRPNAPVVLRRLAERVNAGRQR